MENPIGSVVNEILIFRQKLYKIGYVNKLQWKFKDTIYRVLIHWVFVFLKQDVYLMQGSAALRQPRLSLTFTYLCIRG